MIGLRYAWFYCMFFRHKLIYVYLTYSVITGPLEYKREEPPQLVTRKSSSPKDLNPRRFCGFSHIPIASTCTFCIKQMM